MRLILLGFVALATASHAAISISDFHLTETSVAFDISGTLPTVGPGASRHSLIFSNPSILANPGFALGEFLNAQAVSFTGTQLIGVVSTGGSQFGDYFYIGSVDVNGSARDLLPGEAINGCLVAQWSGQAFDPSATPQLNLYWGDATGSSLANTGVLLTVTQVPEPNALCLLCLGLLIGISRRVRRAKVEDITEQ